jgi:hypothetical protein
MKTDYYPCKPSPETEIVIPKSQYISGGWQSVKYINAKSGTASVSRRLVLLIRFANRGLG